MKTITFLYSRIVFLITLAINIVSLCYDFPKHQWFGSTAIISIYTQWLLMISIERYIVHDIIERGSISAIHHLLFALFCQIVMFSITFDVSAKWIAISQFCIFGGVLLQIPLLMLFYRRNREEDNQLEEHLRVCLTKTQLFIGYNENPVYNSKGQIIMICRCNNNMSNLDRLAV